MESHYRSITKAIIWRTSGTIVTFVVAWIFTGSLSLSAGIGLLDSLVKIGAFYVHERIWDHLEFGRLKPTEYQI